MTDQSRQVNPGKPGIKVTNSFVGGSFSFQAATEDFPQDLLFFFSIKDGMRVSEIVD